MFEPYLPVIAPVGLALLLVLCLPFVRIQKLVLELSALVLRLAFLALLGAAAYLWFHPSDLPAEVMDTSNSFLSTFPRPRGNLPRPGTPYFGICAAALLRGLGSAPARRARRQPQAGRLAAPSSALLRPHQKSWSRPHQPPPYSGSIAGPPRTPSRTLGPASRYAPPRPPPS